MTAINREGVSGASGPRYRSDSGCATQLWGCSRVLSALTTEDADPATRQWHGAAGSVSSGLKYVSASSRTEHLITVSVIDV